MLMLLWLVTWFMTHFVTVLSFVSFHVTHWGVYIACKPYDELRQELPNICTKCSNLKTGEFTGGCEGDHVISYKAVLTRFDLLVMAKLKGMVSSNRERHGMREVDPLQNFVQFLRNYSGRVEPQN